MSRSANMRLYAISAVIVVALFGGGGVLVSLIVAAKHATDAGNPATDAAGVAPGQPLVVEPVSVWSEPGAEPAAPAWAPNGRLLAFEVPRAFGTVKLFAAEVQDDGRAFASPIAADGTPDKQRFRLMQQPTWFGSMIVFEGQVERSAVRRLYRAPPNGGAAMEVFDITVVDGTLADVAVDSTVVGRIAFVSQALQDGQLYLWDPRVGKVRQIDPAPGIEHAPVFSADGNVLIYGREIDGDDDLYQFDLRKPKSALLVGGPGDQIRPTVLPDNRVLFFTSADGNAWDVAITNGKEVRVIAPNVKLPARGGPSVSPDGLWVAWIGADDPNMLRFTSMVDGRLVEITPEGVTGIDELRIATKDGRMRVAFVGSAQGVTGLFVADLADHLAPLPPASAALEAPPAPAAPAAPAKP